jgi:hypothetical protein
VPMAPVAGQTAAAAAVAADWLRLVRALDATGLGVI